MRKDKSLAKCPFLAKRKSCFAAADVYLPSYFQYLEYCRSHKFVMCPFYQMAANNSALFETA